MKRKRRNRIFSSIIRGGFAHTIAMFTIWMFCLRRETMYPGKAFVWFFVCPTILYLLSLITGMYIESLGNRYKIDEDVFERLMTFFYVTLCCTNYIFMRKFTMSFLILVLPFILLLLERRSKRNISHVIFLIAFYIIIQFLPGRLPYEPSTPLPYDADIIFAIYISVCIMILLRETKDTYAISFKEKEESELRLNTYREFLMSKNQDVREAVHNVKGTGEMILRYNASDASAADVVTVMDACNRITERVDRILESSRLELFRKNSGHTEEMHMDEPAEDRGDGTYLYAPNAYILVADDSVEALNLIRVLLARTGIRIDTVFTGAEALKMIGYNYYNLILLDHMLPDMSSVSVKRAIKDGNGINASTPVLVMSRGDHKEVRELYAAEGFADIIAKPFSGEKIERTIEKYLSPRLVNRVMEEKNEGGLG